MQQKNQRAGKADDYDDHRNIRSGMSPLDAARYVENLPVSDPRLVRMDEAGPIRSPC